MKVLILSGPNHGFDECAVVIDAFLSRAARLDVRLEEDRDILASEQLAEFDVCVFGTGFTRAEAQPEGPAKRVPDLPPALEEGLFGFVERGGGLVGVHGTAWWIGGQAVDLMGGHANWHPPGLRFTVRIQDDEHEVTQGVADFEVEDEIYMSAWDPRIHILATAEWAERSHPVAWVKPYGDGRVFYSALGHGPGTFEVPGMQALLTRGVCWAGSAEGASP